MATKKKTPTLTTNELARKLLNFPPGTPVVVCLHGTNKVSVMCGHVLLRSDDPVEHKSAILDVSPEFPTGVTKTGVEVGRP